MANDMLRINFKLKRPLDQDLFDYLSQFDKRKRAEQLRHLGKVGLFSIQNNVPPASERQPVATPATAPCKADTGSTRVTTDALGNFGTAFAVDPFGGRSE